MQCVEVKMKINFLFTVFLNGIINAQHVVFILQLFFLYIVNGAKRLLGILPLLHPPGCFAPIVVCLCTPELTKSLHDSGTTRVMQVNPTVLMQNMKKEPS